MVLRCLTENYCLHTSISEMCQKDQQCAGVEYYKITKGNKVTNNRSNRAVEISFIEKYVHKSLESTKT